MQTFEASEKQHVLIVDDMLANLFIAKSFLENDYHIIEATSGAEALQKATDPYAHINLILLDVQMPGMDGYTVCQKLKENPITESIPIIFVTANNTREDEKHGFDIGCVDYITKPISGRLLKARVKTHLALYNQQRLLEQQVHERTKELEDTRLELIYRLGIAAEFKDADTGLHIIRMSHYARILAEGLDLNPIQIQEIFQAAPMHDIGKIGIPDHILKKPGKLDADEWEIMKTHSQIGADILGKEHAGIASSSKHHGLLNTARTIALTHHEKWDGSGYPQGLSGTDIPLAGRIIAIADVFDALSSKRTYKSAWSDEQVLEFMREQRGQHFDPNLVDTFMNNLPKIMEIHDRYVEPTINE